MTQGVFSSLNLTLSRLNSIESNFSALAEISNQLSANSNVENQKSDFQKILDTKLSQNSSLDEENKKTDNEIKEIVDLLPLDETIDEIKKEAINLKSKIDLKAQITNIDDIIDTYSEKYNLDSNFIKAVIKQESGFNTKALSKKGAMGLMQLMPATAKSLGVNDAFNPQENIEGGVKYLKGLLDRFQNDKKLALAAYNAGPNAVKRYGGIPPYKETQNYVNSIMKTYEKLETAKNIGGAL